MGLRKRGRARAVERPAVRRPGYRLGESIEGYAFIAPALLLIAFFGIAPLFYAIFVSLHVWRIREGAFIGLRNYRQIFGTPGNAIAIVLAVGAIALGAAAARLARRTPFPAARILARIVAPVLIVGGILATAWMLAQIYVSGDSTMLDSLRVTIWYSLGTVPVQLLLGLLLAVALSGRFRGREAFRMLFLLPYIVPTVASAAVFQIMLSLRPQSLANQIVALFGGHPLQWLYEPAGIFHLIFGIGPGPVANGQPPAAAHGLAALGVYGASWEQGPSLALVSVMIYNYWVFAGYYALIYLNGLAQIPRELYDAAAVDGAGRMVILRRIILPLLSPSTYFLSLIGIIGTFKAFNHIYVLRSPAAEGTIDPMSIYIFFTFFRMSRFGYAAALSLVLFLIVLILTLAQRRIMEGRVFYGE